MSDREELARAVWAAEGRKPEGFDNPMNVGLVRKSSGAADALWAAGWRKKPSAAELVLVLVETNGLSYGERADAILARMDGPTGAGASNE